MPSAVTATAQKLSLAGQIASQAEFVVDNLQRTQYQHPFEIDVDRGTYYCDCNGFVSFVMERAAPGHYAAIPKEPGHLHPRAFKYFEFFVSLTSSPVEGWHRIEFLKNVRRGDVIAWRFPEIEKGKDTGHVLFVADTPVVDQSGVFTIRVYDSANQPHLKDTRGKGAGEFPTGVGSGSIKFKADNTGKPTAFQFAPSDEFKTFPIAMGRAEPLA